MSIKNIMKRFFLFTAVFFTLSALAQNFVNGDLNGTVGIAALPTGWQSVPFGDVNCVASSVLEATPDLTDLNGPSAASGINGTPYSGLTFLSGLYTHNGGAGYYHEGIMQTVSGLTINQSYQISFFQAVVKQKNCLDRSGSWAVYIDSTLAGISAVTYDSSNYTVVSLFWEQRLISFQAKKTSHIIKFLPMDNDTNHTNSQVDTAGGIRMGIDLISFVLGTGVECQKNRDLLNFVYPNPATDKIIVSVGKECRIEILSADGLLVKTLEADASRITIALDDLESGVYFLRTINTGKTEYQRFMKI